MALELLSPWIWVVTMVVVVAVSVVTALGSSTGKSTLMPELPRGSWSLPFIGDALQVWRQGLHQFLINHFARLGDPFRMTLFGSTIIVMNTPESIKNILSTAHMSVAYGYPKQVSLLMGSDKFMGSPSHTSLRKVALATFTLSNRRGDSVSFINSKARERVDSWERVPGGTVNICDEMDKFTLSVIVHFLWADVTSSTKVESLREGLEDIHKGMESLLINLPHFQWYRALKARDSILVQIQESLAKRRKEGIHYDDYLGGMMNVENISDENLCGAVFALMVAAYVATSGLITWTIKHLSDNPTVLGAIRAEQDRIREKMEFEGHNFFESFGVKESMPLTSQMIDEVLRLQSPQPMMCRQTLESIEYKGIAIPKGTTVWASVCSIHMNPEYYPDPLVFNPSRFEIPPKPNTFLPFGIGPNMCPGANFAKTNTVFLLHHLLTKYTWKPVGQDGGNYPTDKKPKNGYPIVVQKRI